MPEFTCDLSQEPAHFDHVWERVVGSGHAPLALRADWQAQLLKCHRELGFERVRFHGLLSDPMGTLVHHGEELRYSFFNADQIFDYLLSIGMRPFVELSFMPAAIAAGGETVFNYQSIVTPPEDYGQWATLIEKLVRHWLERYGSAEMQEWFFEVWNEPNLKHFWTGSQEEYFKLYRYTVEAIKRVDPQLRVGGPVTANNAWIPEFLNYCETHDLPVDFVSTHHYPTDAFGKEGADTQAKLAQSERSVLRERAAQAHEAARGHPLYYTEWNSSSNPRDPLHDLPYAATVVVKTMMEATGLVEGYSFWTFSDIFEELYFPSEPFHGGFGLLNVHGIPKPTYRAFELLHALGNEALAVQGEHATVDLWAVLGDRSVTVLITNHALPRHEITSEHVTLHLGETALEPRAVHARRIDEDHANPRRLWEEMDRPTYLKPHKVTQLQVASRLEAEPLGWRYADRTVTLELTVPPHSVTSVTLEFLSAPAGLVPPHLRKELT